MTHSPQKKKLDDLLTGAVDLRPQPDFAAWRRRHPQAVEALRSLPLVLAKRRSTMNRALRYIASAAAVLILLAAGAWWMLFSHGASSAWAEVIDRLAQVRSATCNVCVGCSPMDRIYLEGSRVRIGEPGANRFGVMDFRKGTSLWVNGSAKTALIGDLKKDFGGLFVPGSDPLNDLLQMKTAPAERLPDEQIGDVLCQVYRVTGVAFLGCKVPWVKLWLDPRSKLPVEIHAVIMDREAVTLTDFRWNEPLDKDLFELAVPKGYRLVEPPGAAALAPAGPAKKGAGAEAGRQIPTGEIAKTLDMLGQRIEANYKAIDSWSGTFDVKERNREGGHVVITHAAVDFFAEPGRGRLRINYRAVEPVKMIGLAANCQPACQWPESRWVRTPEQWLRFPVSGGFPDSAIERFPRADGPRTGQAPRVLFREPPKAVNEHRYQDCIDPLIFFGECDRPYWQFCSTTAAALRGQRGARLEEEHKKRLTLRERRRGAVTEYILSTQVGGGSAWEKVFSSSAGFNIVSDNILLEQGQPRQTWRYTFRTEKGVFIPSEVEYNMYQDDPITKDSSRVPTQHRVFTLKTTRVNEAIDPGVFEVQSLGLRRGDRMIDEIENRFLVFDGKTFVPVPRRKLPLVPDTQRVQATNNMKLIGLAIHNYVAVNGHFPPAYVADKNGKPLLSWRVLILPYGVLHDGDLGTQFHLDEPWDSPHNRPLIARMPAVYRSPNSTVSDQGKTNYLTIRGKDTVFPGRQGITFPEIRDGTSCTIMTVEASDAKAVIWTRPDDFDYDQPDPLRGLVGLWPDGFLVGLADGSARFAPSSIDPAVLKALFRRNAGKKASPEALGK
jgi:hypothetical protein